VAAGALVVLAAVVVVVLGLSGGDEETGSGARPRSDPETQRRVERIARRIERIRGLGFDEVPRVEVVRAEQVRRFALGRFDSEYPRERQLRDEEALKLLGLLAPDDRIRDIVAKVFSEKVAGFYDPKSDRLSVVGGGLRGFEAEITLAHELVHALEDQRFELDLTDTATFADDRLEAEQALIEGTATVAMSDYAIGNLAGGGAPAGDRRLVIKQLASAGIGDIPGLPPYVQASLIFPYAAGAAFVDRLERRGGWGAVDRALEDPPVSTEQVIHPRAYLDDVRPAAVRLSVGDRLGAGWRRVSASAFGEFDTSLLLQIASSEAVSERAADGWAGGRAELWRRGRLDDERCAAPCAERDVLVLGWRFDDAAQAAEFRRAAERWLGSLGAPDGRGGFVLERGGAAALSAKGAAVTVAMAPTPALARVLVRRG